MYVFISIAVELIIQPFFIDFALKRLHADLSFACKLDFLENET